VPELPEVETVRRGLEARVVGRLIEDVEVGRERTVRRTSSQALVDGLRGVRLLAAGRHGKYLVSPLDSGLSLMIHLRMSGRLLLAPTGSPRPAHTHVALRLEGGDELRFVDPRTFGEVVVFDPDHVAQQVPELARMGIDALSDELDRAAVRDIVLGRHRQMKALLLDQHVIAGIGNIYADEILHRARLRPDRVSSSLTPREVTRLHGSIREVLLAAVDGGGSTLRDTQYVDLMGEGGSYQLEHRVYDRGGQRCLTCGRADIVRVVSNGRSTSYCPRCQPAARAVS
jgi:formamidopyrimidine-DNA glycosylase